MTTFGDPAHAHTHVEEALSLDADGYANLFSIRMSPLGLPDVLLTLTPQKSVSWQGYPWESYGITITDYRRESSGEASRPKLTVFNPDGVFSRYVHARWMDSAEVIRYRVLGQHLSANINSFLKNTWRVAKVLNLSKQSATFELREAIDGQFFVLPGRAYYPPDFPAVSL